MDRKEIATVVSACTLSLVLSAPVAAQQGADEGQMQQQNGGMGMERNGGMGMQREGGMGMEQEGGMGMQQQGAGQQALDMSTAWRASDLMDKEVNNAQGENLGSISNLIVDQQSGQVTHILLAQGGVLGVGATNYVVPFDRLQISPAGDVVLDISRDQVATEFSAFEEARGARTGRGQEDVETRPGGDAGGAPDQQSQ